MTGADGPPAPEFSRRLALRDVKRSGRESRRLVANLAEREALAERLGLLFLDRLEADLVIAPWRGEGFAIEGSLSADLAQPCVVTLEPVPQHITEPVAATYWPRARGSAAPAESDDLVDPEAPDPPEPVPENGFVDLGELVVQQLAVALDPYPRSPEARISEAGAGTRETAAPGPFAALAALKGRARPQD